MSASRSTSKPVMVPSRRADIFSRLDLVAAVVRRHQRLGPGLGVLDRLAQPAGDHQRDDLLGGDLQFAAEPAADVRGDHPELVLRDALGERDHQLEDVRDLGRRPHGDLLAGRVDHGRPRLHERRDQPLLAEDPFDDDLIGVGRRRGQRVVDAPARCRRRRSRRPTPRSGWCRVPGGRAPLRRPARLPCRSQRGVRRSRRRSLRAASTASALVRAATTATISPAWLTR